MSNYWYKLCIYCSLNLPNYFTRNFWCFECKQRQLLTKMTTTSWWFQMFFISTPTWKNDQIWRAYFSSGLDQPPTRQLYRSKLIKWPFQLSSPIYRQDCHLLLDQPGSKGTKHPSLLSPKDRSATWDPWPIMAKKTWLLHALMSQEVRKRLVSGL